MIGVNARERERETLPVPRLPCDAHSVWCLVVYRGVLYSVLSLVYTIHHLPYLVNEKTFCYIYVIYRISNALV